MKFKQKLTALIGFAFLIFTSCQEEVSEINEIVQPESAVLANCNSTEDIIGWPGTIRCGKIKSHNPEIDFATSNFPGHIVTGIGLNTTNTKVKNITLWGYQLDSDGNLCDRRSIHVNNGSPSVELQIHADPGYAVVGVGALVANSDIKMIRIWQRQIMSDARLNSRVFEKTVFTNSQYNKATECGVNKSGWVEIQSQVATTYMTGLKMKVDYNDVVGYEMFTGSLDL